MYLLLMIEILVNNRLMKNYMVVMLDNMLEKVKIHN